MTAHRIGGLQGCSGDAGGFRRGLEAALFFILGRAPFFAFASTRPRCKELGPSLPAGTRSSSKPSTRNGTRNTICLRHPSPPRPALTANRQKEHQHVSPPVCALQPSLRRLRPPELQRQDMRFFETPRHQASSNALSPPRSCHCRNPTWENMFTEV